MLRALTHEDTGGIVAAATTSLPEEFGGAATGTTATCWLRDASLTLTVLLAHGYTDEATPGATGCCARSPATPPTCRSCTAWPASGDLAERELASLPGYQGARPVRIGNGAVGQYQADVFGEVMVALQTTRARAGNGDRASPGRCSAR